MSPRDDPPARRPLPVGQAPGIGGGHGACAGSRPSGGAGAGGQDPPRYSRPMEFRRITGLPPYVFTIIDGLKIEARRAGIDVIDLGFGNPDIPSPELAVAKLCEADHNTRNHRYSASR